MDPIDIKVVSATISDARVAFFLSIRASDDMITEQGNAAAKIAPTFTPGSIGSQLTIKNINNGISPIFRMLSTTNFTFFITLSALL